MKIEFIDSSIDPPSTITWNALAVVLVKGIYYTMEWDKHQAMYDMGADQRYKKCIDSKGGTQQEKNANLALDILTNDLHAWHIKS